MRRFGYLLLCALSVGCAPSDEVPQTKAGPATRIVSLAPNITELVYAAGAGDRLVGTVEYSDYPPAALELPRIGDSVRIDYEALRLLEPDLVLAWESGNPGEIVQRMRQLGYRVVTLEPRSLAAIADELLRIGELTGTQEQAVGAERDFRAELAKLRTESSGQRRVLSVFWQISANPYFTVTGEHVINEIIELCGGQNIFAELSGLAPPVTLEAILARKPDTIIASVKPGDEQWKESWREWENLPAVVNDHLFSVDPDLVSRSGPRIAQGAAEVCHSLDRARNQSR
jgi:iron complex transport system substrate-binding protein